QKIIEVAKKAGFHIQITSRAKHFYSIYQKMKKRNKGVEELYDLFAMRILCTRVSDCYTLMGLVHTLWQPIDGRFKDYIAKPKENGYQSLHTSVICEEKPLEIQIRTGNMHEAAENGIAAHWLYKKGSNKDAVNVENLTLVSQMKDLKDAVTNYDTASIDEFFMHIKAELLAKSIFVFTPKGDVVELPTGSTAIDFAYSVHTSVGQKIYGAKANGHIIPLTKPLQNIQTIEIITNVQAHPTVNQLEVVKTSKARSKIRAWLYENEEAFRIKEKVEESKVTHGQHDLHEQHAQHKKHIDEFTKENSPLTAKIRIGDTNNFLFSFAKCCLPTPQDEVVGYISRGRGIIVHKKQCKNFWNNPQLEQRFVHVEWD
ncbi:MAG: TGS domain-containing protein, partial [Treponemataceae bacterium]